ncbi:Protease HtpX [Paraburkholderia nemoris]|uniref:M48 family metalloprotease n=1 Tax=Paraburkholderia nemoris TaxID=2793076 RepID=UPI001914494B|nr:M48 family metalloprotease [Paraburkholderia nemoris]MBK5152896.1 M48 family metalloprotease [Burkholderia sp. R-69608]CAE6970629.1 Protease HtpX [Paraburkholderia nemoris]
MSSPITSPGLARGFLVSLASLFFICLTASVLHSKFDLFSAAVIQIASFGCLALAMPVFAAGKYVFNTIQASTQNLTLMADERLTAVVHPLIEDLPHNITVRWYDSTEANAFAISSVFGQSALIAFSSRMLEVCTPQQLTAIAAHEVAHVRHGDSRNKACILAFYEAIQIYPRFFSEISKVVLKQAVPVMALLFVLTITVVAFFAGPVKAAHAATPLLLILARYIVIAAAFIGGFVLLERKLLEKYFAYSRAREFDADAAAAAMTSAADVASALKMLNAPATSIGVFDTHPSLDERIARLVA